MLVVMSAFYVFENECVMFMHILKWSDYHLRYQKKVHAVIALNPKESSVFVYSYSCRFLLQWKFMVIF